MTLVSEKPPKIQGKKAWFFRDFSTNAKKYPLHLELLPEKATSEEIKWTSSDPSVVEASNLGYLTTL